MSHIGQYIERCHNYQFKVESDALVCIGCWIPCCIYVSTSEDSGQLLRHGVADDETTYAPEDSSQLDAGKGTMVEQENRKLDCGYCWGVKRLSGQDELTISQPDTLQAF